MEHTFSFVLPAYKAKYLADAVRSILNQTYKNFELIIVNDDSPEDLDSIVKKFKDTRIRYYKNRDNIGGKDLVSQWNHCIEFAKNDYIILASDDDFYNKDFLKNVSDLAEKYPQVNLIRSRIKRVNEKNELVDKDPIVEELLTCQEFAYYLSHVLGHCIANYVFKREPLMAHGGFVNFPMAWFSDDATILLHSQQGVANTHSCEFNYRISKETISTNINKSTLIKKEKATEMFGQWFDNWFQSISKFNHEFSSLNSTTLVNTESRIARYQMMYLSPFNRMGLFKSLKIISKSRYLTLKNKSILISSYFFCWPFSFIATPLMRIIRKRNHNV